MLCRTNIPEYKNVHLTYKILYILAIVSHCDERCLLRTVGTWHTLLDIIIDALGQIICHDKQILLVFANVISQMERRRVFNYNKFSRLIESTCGIMKFFPSFVRAQNTEIKRDINVKQNSKERNGKHGVERQRKSVRGSLLFRKRSWSRRRGRVSKKYFTPWTIRRLIVSNNSQKVVGFRICQSYCVIKREK